MTESLTHTHTHTHTNRWMDVPCSWAGRINIVKVTVLTNTIHRFNDIPIKLLMAFFTEVEQKFHSSYGNAKDPERPKPSRERRMGWEESADFRLYYKDTVIKRV